MVDALTQEADEGRPSLRKAAVSWLEALLAADVRMGKPRYINCSDSLLNS